MSGVAVITMKPTPLGMTDLLSDSEIAQAVCSTDDLVEHLTHIARRKLIRRFLREWHPNIAHEIQARWDARRLARSTGRAAAPARVGRL